jgi:hypothetical protein
MVTTTTPFLYLHVTAARNHPTSTLHHLAAAASFSSHHGGEMIVRWKRDLVVGSDAISRRERYRRERTIQLNHARRN